MHVSFVLTSLTAGREYAYIYSKFVFVLYSGPGHWDTMSMITAYLSLSLSTRASSSTSSSSRALLPSCLRAKPTTTCLLAWPLVCNAHQTRVAIWETYSSCKVCWGGEPRSGVRDAWGGGGGRIERMCRFEGWPLDCEGIVGGGRGICCGREAWVFCARDQQYHWTAMERLTRHPTLPFWVTMTNIRSSNVWMRSSVSTSHMDWRSWYDWIGGEGWVLVVESGRAEYDSSSRDDISGGPRLSTIWE